MKAVVLLFAAAVALTALAPAEPAVAQQTSAQKKRPFVLKGGGRYPVKRRAYSQLRKSDTLESRKFNDPALGPRSQGQPFDNGFFFETPTGPFGGNTPYMR